MAKVESFRFWCQKVLPLVYDDSLSYYELLCKMVTYLNHTINAVNENTDDVTSMRTELTEFETSVDNRVDQLESFMNNYFNNLDVQNEINEKLDAMAESGELNEIIAPFIPNIVADWLNKHITPTTPAIDNTLSVSGAGADAKVTGDLLRTKFGFVVLTSNNYSDYTTDLNNITESVSYGMVGVSSLITNFPTHGFSSAPTCFVSFCSRRGYHSAGDCQIMFDGNNNYAIRLYASNNWQTWREINHDEHRVVTSANYTTIVTDLNNITKNCMYSMVGVSGLIANYPSRGFSNTPILFIHLNHNYGTHTDGDLQIIFSDKTNYAMRIYAFGSWSSWSYGTDRVESFIVDNNNFASVIKEANTSKADKVYVYVKKGVYDLNVELASYFASASRSISECVVSRDMEIVFEQGAKVVCNYDGNNDFIKSEFSVLTSRTNDLTLINANIECSNIRYCIHDEHGTDTSPYTSKYIDCIMKIDNRENTEWTAGNCIGGGLGRDGYVVIDGGMYDGDGTNTSNLCDIRYHNNGNYSDAYSHVVVKNVYCKRTFGSYSYGTSTTLSDIVVCNNSLGADVAEGYSTGGEVYNMKVTKWNNVIRS